eukprot:EG_transcript_34237
MQAYRESALQSSPFVSQRQVMESQPTVGPTPVSLTRFLLVAASINAVVVAAVMAVANKWRRTSHTPCSSTPSTPWKSQHAAATGRYNLQLCAAADDSGLPEVNRQFQDVPLPKKEPRFTQSPVGFVPNAELFNSRAAMAGFALLLLLEAILNQPLLKVLGVDI